MKILSLAPGSSVIGGKKNGEDEVEEGRSGSSDRRYR